ncbi:hypothetical protein BOC39_26620 [Burkholderia pseudomallei]|nr:hypothetical protein BOC39_26620 [Burkholderia pseudomallei]
MFRPFDLSTFRPFDLSTFRPFDLSTIDHRPSTIDHRASGFGLRASGILPFSHLAARRLRPPRPICPEPNRASTGSAPALA